MVKVRSNKAEPYFDDRWFTNSILLHALLTTQHFYSFYILLILWRNIIYYMYGYFKINFLSFVLLILRKNPNHKILRGIIKIKSSKQGVR